MKILLDTCTFLWLLEDSPKLSTLARKLYQEPEHEYYLSAVSVWEIASKHLFGKLTLPAPPEILVPQQRQLLGLFSLPLTEEAALHVRRLPLLHKDPFDRMLVAQALLDGMTILTPDPAINQYPARVLW